MKRISLIIGFQLVIIFAMFAQNQNSDLLNQRNQLYNHYKSFKDTMTIRTWINMVELSKRAESVVVQDNLILDSLLLGTPVQANDNVRIQELSNEKDQLIQENLRLNQINESFTKTKNTYIFVAVIMFVLFLIALISWIKSMSQIKNIRSNKSKEDNKVLYLKQQHKEEMDALKEEIEKLNDDKLIMENSADQMKKSFDVLKTEATTKKESQEESSSVDDEALDEIRKEMKELTSEIAKVLLEKQKLEEELLKANEKLKNQNEATKSVENELESLLKKLKKE